VRLSIAHQKGSVIEKFDSSSETVAGSPTNNNNGQNIETKIKLNAIKNGHFLNKFYSK
jgi:hypothetical protein